MAHAVALKQQTRHPSFPTVQRLSPNHMEPHERSPTKAMTHTAVTQNSAVNIVDEEQKSHIKSGEYNVLSKASLTTRL